MTSLSNQLHELVGPFHMQLLQHGRSRYPPRHFRSRPRPTQTRSLDISVCGSLPPSKGEALRDTCLGLRLDSEWLLEVMTSPARSVWL